MNMKRKLISLNLILLLLVSFIPLNIVHASADGDKGYAVFHKNDDTDESVSKTLSHFVSSSANLRLYEIMPYAIDTNTTKIVTTYNSQADGSGKTYNLTSTLRDSFSTDQNNPGQLYAQWTSTNQPSALFISGEADALTAAGNDYFIKECDSDHSIAMPARNTFTNAGREVIFWREHDKTFLRYLPNESTDSGRVFVAEMGYYITYHYLSLHGEEQCSNVTYGRDDYIGNGLVYERVANSGVLTHTSFHSLVADRIEKEDGIYQFVGWNSQNDGNGTWYPESSTASNLPHELYAQYTKLPDHYYLKKQSGNMPWYEVLEMTANKAEITLSTDATAWCKKADGASLDTICGFSDSLKDKSIYLAGTKMEVSSGDVLLPIDPYFKIEFNKNLPESSATRIYYNFASHGNLVLHNFEDVFTDISRQDFLCWNTQSDGTGASYEAAQELSWNVEPQSLSLFAQWTGTQTDKPLLTGLSLSEGKLSPNFSPEIFEYTATVSNSTSSIVIMPMAEAAYTVSVNGTDISGENSYCNVDLSVGSNIVEIRVNSQNEINQIYRITVIRDSLESDLPVEATSITINPNLASVRIGSSIKMTALLTPPNSTNRVKWRSDDVSIATVDDSTGVVIGVSEGTTIITAETSNAITATCEVTVYKESSIGSSSGGGGSSSSSKPSTSGGKTDTTTKPDGTKVQTETKADGTKIQTVTNKDGSVTKTTTNPNGSSVTETKAADGSTGIVKTDKHGQTTAETTLSSKAIETAKRNGEPVTAPVEVEATRDSSTAPTVKIELPRNSGETKVEIPVTNVKPGTVAVIVHPDGTEEIVKNSLPTEDGIQLTVNGGATVKIVDNSKDFVDTRSHWAKDAIDFVSARGLVNGMNAVSYAPNASTTRAQLWTILARQNDADLTGGATWFENAQNWAKAKGISDGTNPNGTINRAQMVTMLWRTMGQPAAAGSASFADVPADSYYAQAVAWAIENGITAGVGGGRFDPNSTCTRGQIATFLYRYMK